MSTGLSDSRMTASTTPSATPKIIAKIVTRMVPFQKPSITGVWIIASKTNGQLNAGLLISRLRNMARKHRDHCDGDPATGMADRYGLDQPGAVIADRRRGCGGGCHDVGLTAKSEMAPCSTPHFSSAAL